MVYRTSGSHEWVAAGDTWGVSGPQFLVGYWIAFAVLLFSVLVRQRLLLHGGGAASGPADGLAPVELSLLNGGDGLAVVVALAGLRDAGLIDEAGKVIAQPSGLTKLDPVSKAVLTYLARPNRRRVNARQITVDPTVRRAVESVREGLTRRGLLVDPAAARSARRRRWVLGLVPLVGLVRLIDGAHHHKPVGLLVFSLIVSVIVIGVARPKAAGVTGSGRAALREAKDANAHLSPRHNPSWTTYPAGATVLAVALFGATALWSADPAFAAAAELGKNASLTNGGWSGGGVSSCSGGSSCGGGSGCGGGGCGGGGCGGGGCGG